MPTRIALDHYVYEDIYPAYKAATDEKELTAKINRAFLNALAKSRLVLTGDDPLAVADIGCGPCDTLIRYLAEVTFAPGFEVRATDFLPAYADSENGEALRLLSEAKAAGALKLSGFSTRAGDAFAGSLLPLLSGPDDGGRMRGAFRIVFASHVIYHAQDSAAVQRFIADVADNLLAQDGVCVMYHVGYAKGTFQEFRARFGSRAESNRESNTGAVTIDDPPARIAAACESLRLPFWDAKFISDLWFGKLSDEHWEHFKVPDRYDSLARSDPAAYEDLKRLYFVVQRAPKEFAADHSATGLPRFLDEIRSAIEFHGNNLPATERMQIFCRDDAPARLREGIERAIGTVTQLQS